MIISFSETIPEILLPQIINTPTLIVGNLVILAEILNEIMVSYTNTALKKNNLL